MTLFHHSAVDEETRGKNVGHIDCRTDIGAGGVLLRVVGVGDSRIVLLRVVEKQAVEDAADDGLYDSYQDASVAG